MKAAAPPTAGEFELMEILWLLGEASVKQVWERVDRERDLAYTTVMTVLDKMHRKGLVHQRKQGKAFFYRPAVGREAALASLLQDLVDTYFDGSRAGLAAFVAEWAATGAPPAPARPPQPAQASSPPAATRAETSDQPADEMDESLL